MSALSDPRTAPLHAITAPERSIAPDRRTSVPSGDPLRRIGWLLALTDLVVLVTAFVVAHLVRFPWELRSVHSFLDDLLNPVVGAVIVVVWFVALRRSRDPRVIGAGQDEYRRMVSASLATGGIVAVVSYAAHIDIARGYVAIAFPLGVVGLAIGRKCWRSRIARLRSVGRLLTDVLLVGELDDVRFVGLRIAASPATGYRVRGVVTDCVPVGTLVEGVGGGADGSAAVLGGIDAVVGLAQRSGVGAVVLAGAVDGGHDRLRRIGWQLEELGVELVVSSPLVDIAQARVHHRPVDGLPLMHVETPDYARPRVGKRLLDVAGAGVGLALLAPVFAVIALLIRLDDHGPVFFRQTRVGRGGAEFQILKFRTMCVDAESRVTELERLNDGAGPLFKIKHDPRVTRIGSFLRTTSLDELPQLWNVLVGTMSLVGPRPALPREVALYVDFADRRLLVTPGITGLWQVSGRSDLDWADGVRLDLHYVENWSFVHDLVILGRTIPSVVRSRGAY